MTPQYSEDSVLWRLGRAPQLPACPCTHPTKPRRPSGLEVIRSTEERHRDSSPVAGQHPAHSEPTHAPHSMFRGTHPDMLPPQPLSGTGHPPCKGSTGHEWGLPASRGQAYSLHQPSPTLGLPLTPHGCLLPPRAIGALTSHTCRTGTSTHLLHPHPGLPTAQVPTRHSLCREEHSAAHGGLA